MHCKHVISLMSTHENIQLLLKFQCFDVMTAHTYSINH